MDAGPAPEAADPPGGAPLLVDALNVIGSRPTGWWRDRPGAIRGLAERLRRYADATGADVTLVVDGRPLPDLPEGARGGLQVRYATRGGRNAADDRIVALVGERGSGVEVVTADRELQERVRARGATTVSPRRLLAELDRL
jgi:predicted RNA-binding protein with PIN domain